MKNLSVPAVLAAMLSLTPAAQAADAAQQREYIVLASAAEDNYSEIDHNADGMVQSEGGDSYQAPMRNAPVKEKPLVRSNVVKKTESGTRNPAPKVARVKTLPARDIPLIETRNAVESSPDITYVTGGIGDDERSSIESAKSDYNLHVMSASANGAFVGDARFIITSKDDAKEMLNVVAGPLLYVKLPAGRYALNASRGEQKKHQDFSISDKKPSADVHLGWKVDTSFTE